MAARRLHGLIYATIGLCILIIIVCSVSLGTNQWFSAEGVPTQTGSDGLRIKINYGLFKGKKLKNTGGSERSYDLSVVCQGSKCMYSCGTTGAKRKQELSDILNNKGSDDTICTSDETRTIFPLQDNSSAPDPIFLNFGLYVATIALLVIAILFAAIGGGLALYNTYRTPIQPVLSVLGLYIWNGISAASVLLAMIIWGIAFTTELKKNAATSDTLVARYDSNGRGSLGISYWILILPILFSLINIGILRYRTWKIVKMEEKNVKVMSEKLESGDILLF